MAHTTGSIAQLLGADLSGPADLEILRLDTLGRAGPGALSFIRSAGFASQWPASKASGALVSRGIEVKPDPARALLVVPDADLALNRVLELFAPRTAYAPGIHPTAVIDTSAKIGQGVHIGPHCVVGPRSVIGDGCVFIANVSNGADVAIGRGTTLHPAVVIGDRCVVGQGCQFFGGVVVGADGFGYRPSPDGRGVVKVPHIGNVEIGDGVEIGANSCVDRAKFGSTIIGSGTKIDNLCQIAHNCVIGRACLICGMTALAGSCTVGDGVIIGGHVGVSDNITIGARAMVGAKSGLMNDVPPGETWWGFPATPARDMARSMAATRTLPELARVVRRIGKMVGVEFNPHPGRAHE
jgi:UDP-3-O-[3-hydroxymyristoyl] glucosamine N-acyltransferase